MARRTERRCARSLAVVCAFGGCKKISVFRIELMSIASIPRSSGIRAASASSDALFMRFRPRSLRLIPLIRFKILALCTGKPPAVHELERDRRIES